MATEYQRFIGTIPDSEFQKNPHSIGPLGAATIISNLLEAHFGVDEIVVLLNQTVDSYIWGGSTGNEYFWVKRNNEPIWESKDDTN